MKQVLPKLTSAIIYQMSAGFLGKIQALIKDEDGITNVTEAFESVESVDPGATQWASAGIVKMPDGEWFIDNDSSLSFIVQINERKLPSKVRDELVQEKAAEIERQQGRRPHKKEFRLLIEEAEMALLPKAFIGRSQMLITLTDADKLIIWTTSVKRGERGMGILLAWIEHLIPKAQPQFSNIGTAKEPADVFTSIVKTNPGDNDTLCDGYSAVLKGESEVVRVRNMDLSSTDVQDLLRSDFKVVELQLIYDSKSLFGANDSAPDMTFTVNEGLIFKKIVVPGVANERGIELLDAFNSNLFMITQTLLKAHAALLAELGTGNIATDVEDDDEF